MADYKDAINALKASIPTARRISDDDWYDGVGNLSYRDPTSGAGVAVELDGNNQVEKLRYYDAQGRPLRSSIFTAAELYKTADEYGIDLSGIGRLGQALDAAKINYKPGQLRAGTGSDHGINFADVAAGKLGSAYDWTDDPSAAQKGAAERQAAYQALAQRYGIDLTPSQNLATLSPNTRRGTRNFVVTVPSASGSPTYAFYETEQEARNAAQKYNGTVTDLDYQTVTPPDLTSLLFTPQQQGTGPYKQQAQSDYTKLLNDLRTAARGQLATGKVTKDQLRTYGQNLGLSPEDIGYALGGDDVKAPAYSSYNLQELRKDIGLDAATTALLKQFGDQNVSAEEQLLFSNPLARQLALNTAEQRFLNSGAESSRAGGLDAYGKSIGLNQDLIDYLTGKDSNLELSYADAIQNITEASPKPVVLGPGGNSSRVVGDDEDTTNIGNLSNTGGTKTITRTFADEPDITGKSVPVQGESGLREFYGPYVQQMLQNMSALNALREDPNYRPMKFGDTYGQETAGALNDLAYVRGKRLGDNQDTLKSYTPFNYSFASDRKAARGGLMSLMPERYADGGAVGNTYAAQTVPSTFTAPTDGYQSNQFSSGFTTPSNIYTASPITAGTGTFDATAQQTYMNPFMSGVVDPAIREAKREAELKRQSEIAKFTQAGAFGGSGRILAEQNIGRNLATQIGDIYGKGQASAFENAQKAFENEQNRKLTAGIESEKAKQVGGQQALSSAEIAARLGLEAQGLTEKSKQFEAQYGLDVGKTTAEYDQRARELQQKAEEAQARGDQFAAEQALRELDSAQRAAEAQREFDYKQGRDTYLDPYRELMYQSQLLSGLPIKAGDTGISSSGNALKALLASYGVLFPDETGG